MGEIKPNSRDFRESIRQSVTIVAYSRDPKGKVLVASKEPHESEQFITTSAEVTPNGGLVRESPQNGLKIG